ncbi:MAG: sigma-54-dependent Fis family transcriptional regulator [Sedimentisphaerales bacterium]|nr:sigma-54-dependent Fis family transcriptional regulator [Sedimentisphaerales bacterium]
MSETQKPYEQPCILVADDQPDVLKALRLLLKPEGFQIETASSVAEIIESVKTRDFDVVLMDLNYVRGQTSGEQGLDVLSRIKQIDNMLPVVVMTAWSSVELAVEAMRRGARDFIPKPWKNERLLVVLRTQVELSRSLRKSRQLEQEIVYLKNESSESLIAESHAMQPVLEAIARVGPSDANVLITGENGSGKGVVANALHAASNRKDKTMVSVNTASIPETVFESELFGHVAGAFTDAKTNRLGRFKLADGGTLFLDEIAAVPVKLQSKLLRVLESGEFEPIGSSKTCRVNVRVLSATNADLSSEISSGDFRQDLLYRLNTVEIHVPALRERKEDVPLLATHFLRGYVTKYRKAITGFDPVAMQALLSYHWPGNVRELDHTIERAVLMTRDKLIRSHELGLTERPETTLRLENITLEEMERRAVRKAMARFEGDISKAAEALGLSRAALYRRLEKYQIE